MALHPVPYLLNWRVPLPFILRPFLEQIPKVIQGSSDQSGRGLVRRFIWEIWMRLRGDKYFGAIQGFSEFSTFPYSKKALQFDQINCFVAHVLSETIHQQCNGREKSWVRATQALENIKHFFDLYQVSSNIPMHRKSNKSPTVECSRRFLSVIWFPSGITFSIAG